MKRQEGSVLLISLIMLLILTVVGIASISSVSMTEKMANSQKDYDIAFEMAEAALVEGERWLDNYDAGFSKDHLQTSCSGSNCWKADCTNGQCFNGKFPAGAGTYCDVTPPATDVWQVESYWSSKAKTYSVAVSAVERPKYLLEFLCYTPRDPLNVGTKPPDYGDWVRIYRVTALGFGTNPDTRVMLQSTYRVD
jgi:type IV pilus assembly protein PilX